LGSVAKGRVEVTNSYAVPFEEDSKNPKIWFLDHNYHENMWAMFRKVNGLSVLLDGIAVAPKLNRTIWIFTS